MPPDCVGLCRLKSVLAAVLQISLFMIDKQIDDILPQPSRCI